ncbi:Uracil DNA glycosylase superfamily protein [Promicromonospora umidemergens]|uniref:Uracil DNA glycosylase superfamily protein n=1 Tax=Promicromonospora umidemergens TaxID=629679 RepID=A0ABP8XW65_9MICO|nr:hypothetical protein [Promicromonospora umidemergens]MCP2285155.1 Uracil DNA glycosylase superfamily protein [Promicromonospora umidemergens]
MTSGHTPTADPTDAHEVPVDMRALDAEFRAGSGITERRFYKIFYSHIHPFPLLVLGLNPGGETDGSDLNASESFFENGEHDYVMFRHYGRQYSLAGPMHDLLSTTLGTSSEDEVRQVPATNVIFRRSRSSSALSVSPKVAAHESAPVLRKILQAVNPRAILLLGSGAHKLFVAEHCDTGTYSVNAPPPEIFTPNGLSDACIFRSAQARVTALDRTVPLLMVGHPSTYARRGRWQKVLPALAHEFRRVGVSPFEGIGTSPAAAIAPLVIIHDPSDGSQRDDLHGIGGATKASPRPDSLQEPVPGPAQRDVEPLVRVCAALGLTLEDPAAAWRGYGKVVRLEGDRRIYINQTNADVRASAREVAAWQGAGLGTARPDNEKYLRVMLDGI